MKPVERAAAVYQQEACARTFAEDLEAHMLHGIVVSNPTIFIMARPVCVAAGYRDIVNPWVNDFEYHDCWHLYLWSGPIHMAFACATHPLPYVSFERKNDLRVYPWQKIFRLTHKIG